MTINSADKVTIINIAGVKEVLAGFNGSLKKLGASRRMCRKGSSMYAANRIMDRAARKPNVQEASRTSLKAV